MTNSPLYFRKQAKTEGLKAWPAVAFVVAVLVVSALLDYQDAMLGLSN